MPGKRKGDKTERMCVYMTPETRQLIEKDAVEHLRTVTAEINFIIAAYYKMFEKKESASNTLHER
jgi:hypothetical protein